MKDDYIDAKFEVVHPKRGFFWWITIWRHGFHIDWRNALIIGGMAAATGIAQYLGMF